MAKQQKYYVVWKGRRPGVYDSWAECEAQISGFSGAEYKSFVRRDEAIQAYEGVYADYRGSGTKAARVIPTAIPWDHVVRDSICVDAACSGNPGDVEYRGIALANGEEWFRQGPYPEGTVNIGEFLAIVHALAMLKREGRAIPVYSDSQVAIGWVCRKEVRTKVRRTLANEPLFQLLERSLRWLHENEYPNPLLKWRTDEWGENPADYGRK